MIYRSDFSASERSKIFSVLLCLTLLFNITAVRMPAVGASEASPSDLEGAYSVSDGVSGADVYSSITDPTGSVTVEGVLPDGARLEARELTADETAALSDSGKKIAFAYDITILLGDDEYQPSEPVRVAVTPGSGISGTVSVEHISGDLYGGDTVRTRVESETEDGSVTFEAESFSVYIGTVEYDYSVTLTGGAGIGYYSDSACTEPLSGPVGAYRSTALDIYMKAGAGCTVNGVTVTDEDDGTGAGSVTDMGGNVYRVSFPSGLPSGTKNQIVRVELDSDEIHFDLAKGNVVLNDSTYSGYDSNGNALTDAHVPSNKYIVSQSGSGTTAHTIKVGTTSVCVEKDFIVYLDGVNINIPSGRTEMPVYVNNNGTVYLVLKNGKSNTARITCSTTGISNTNDHAAIEKELSGGSNSNGELVITCEYGYEAYLSDNTKGHDCIHNGTCGKLNAYGANAYGNGGYTTSGGNTWIHGGAAIGSKAAGYKETSTSANGLVSGHININTYETTSIYSLKNIIIAGGDIFAKSAAGGTNLDGGGAGIGTGAGPNPAGTGDLRPSGPELEGLRITGGYIEAQGSSGSTACIGGGYRSNDVHIDIYGGTIIAVTRWKSDSGSGLPKGAGIGSGGGGGNSGSASEAYINIYGGYITAKSVKGAAIGNASGGDGSNSNYGWTCSMYTSVNIYGGTIDARTTGVGPGIGSGGLVGQGPYISKTGDVNINISGGNITAYSQSGADIGTGGMDASNESNHKNTKAGTATVNITGGTINALKGGIGGGTVHSGTGGDAFITINAPDGVINAASIGGGASVTGDGGSASVTVIAGNPNVAGTIGGGASSSGEGGNAVVEINGGNLNCGTIGGGTSTSGYGGNAGVTINDGTLNCGTIGGGSSSTGPGGFALVDINGGTLDCAAIGGGSSTSSSSTSDGGQADVYVTDGTLNVSGAIGGGMAHGSGNGGNAEVNVSGGSLTCASIGGGDCVSGSPGAAQITVSQAAGKTTNITTGYIGGGAGDGGSIGFATADISGGSIQGQFIMASTDPSNPSSFTMTGGVIDNSELGAYGSGEPYAMKKPDGGAVYMDDRNGIANISGGTITGCEAEKGGAVYMTSGTLEMSGTARISGCAAEDEGGAIYLGGGAITMDGGTITGCSAQSGGAVYMSNGELTVSGSAQISSGTAADNGGGIYLGGGTLDMQGGTIKNCSAQTGGGFYVNGGSFEMSGGSLESNTSSGDGGGGAVHGGSVVISGGTVGGPGTGNIAAGSGGGIYVNNGNLLMSAGNVDYNRAQSGSGGGIFVSADGKDVNVAIYSGSVSYNNAAVSGGAMSVEGDKNSSDRIDVVIGVDHEHTGTAFDHTGFDDNTYTHSECPVIEGNKSQVSGGGVLVRGGVNTSLGIFCLTEENNKVGDDASRSEFMMVEGGVIKIGDDDENGHGCQIDVTGTIYVTGGQVDIWGEMENPKIEAATTVDITSAGDYFRDHRPTHDDYKLLYFENFLDPSTGIVTGQYTAYQVPMNASEVQISGVIYNHPGYEIKGWWTKADGTGTKYNVGETYRLEADLTIYAIWEAHGYTVHFEPNVPPNTPYGTMMDDERFTYSQEKALNTNTYSYSGHIFTGWNTKADGTGQSYSDGQVVINLTEEDLATVVLYAQWAVCPHEEELLTYSLEGTDTVRRDCSCGSLTQRMSVSAENAVYDGNAHGASVSPPDNNVPEWEAPGIVYCKVSGGTETVLDDVPVNAGDYRAKITSHGVTAYADYTIEKAPQDPPGRPTAELRNNDNVITVSPVPDNPATGNPSKLILSYKVGDEQQQLGPFDGLNGHSFTLETAWTDYVVLAYYEGSENYLPSEMVAANHIFYQGNTTISINCGEGVSASIQADASNGVDIIYSMLDGYYKPDDFSYTIKVDGTDDLSGIIVNHDSDANTLWISNIGISIRTIEVTLSDARRKPVLTAKAADGEVFGTVTTDSADISRDSAFTVYFETANYDGTEYSGLRLDFGENVPAATTVILIDRSSDSGPTWWSFTAGTAVNSIDMTEFKRMGTSDRYFAPSDGTLKYQFIVDFSDTEYGCSENITPTLAADARSASVPAFPSLDRSLVTLRQAPVFSLSATADRLTGSIDYTYTPSEGYASKWQDRGAAIVLTAEGLPSDAYLRTVTSEGTTDRYSITEGSERCFIIPLGELGSDSVSVTLCSNMFPTAAQNYEFSAALKVSRSASSRYPMNGTDTKHTTFVLSKTDDTTPSLKITGSKLLYSVDETVDVNINYINIPVGSTINVSLQRKGDNGIFAGTGSEMDITEPGNISVSLGGQQSGSFCLRVTVKNGMNRILDVPYYFIVQETA